MKLAPIFGVSLALFLTACGVDFTASTASGDSYQAAVRQADEARGSGDLQTAIALYGRALQADPEGVEAKLGLGETYLSIGAPEEAAAQFRDVLAQRSGNAVARRGLAAALIGMNQPELAEQQLDTALQADARDYRALNALGVALDMQGRHAEAQVRYRRGIELAPDSISLRSNLGLSLAISGEAGPAIALLEPIALSRGADARVRQNLCFAYVMAGEYEKALQMSRRDLPEQEAQRQLSSFMSLKNLPVDARSAEVRRSPYFFGQ